MSNFDYYYVTDSCETTCATCALTDVETELEKLHTEAGDPAGRLLALLRGSKPSDIDDVDRWVDRELCSHYARYNAHNAERNAAAAALYHDLVRGYNDNGDCSNWGETCGGCGTQLVEEWVTCANCDHSDSASSFPFVPDVYTDGDQPHDGPSVEYCGRCEDEYVGGGHRPPDDRLAWLRAALPAQPQRPPDLRRWLSPVHARRGAAPLVGPRPRLPLGR